jgi:hypothetical protein
MVRKDVRGPLRGLERITDPLLKRRERLLLPFEHHPLFPRQVFDLGQSLAGIGHRGAGIFRRSSQGLGYLTGILGQLPPAFLAVSQALRHSTALFVLVAELFASPAKGLGYLPAFFALTPEQFCFLAPPLGGLTGAFGGVLTLADRGSIIHATWELLERHNVGFRPPAAGQMAQPAAATR